MRGRIALGLGMALLAGFVLAIGTQAFAAMAPFETRKIADNVYIFRYMFYQSMFVVTPEGVIATDPINSGTTFRDEIRKITPLPVRFVVYSHHHFDHAGGGAQFEGATFIAHRRAKEHLERHRLPSVVVPNLGIDDRYPLELGGTRLELHYVGRNHSDSMLVMLLPKEKILFAVDFIPIEEVAFRAMHDTFVRELFESLDRVLALDWDRMIPGHPSGGKLGTKDHVRMFKEYLTDLSNAVRQAAAEGKCFDRAMQEIKLPKYEKWANYANYLPGNIERMCFYWRSGYE